MCFFFFFFFGHSKLCHYELWGLYLLVYFGKSFFRVLAVKFFCSHSSSYKKYILGTSLVVQWLRICVAMQGRQILFLVRELRSHMPREQLNPSATITEPTGSGAHAPQPKTPHDSAMISCAVTKTQHSQLNK